MVIEGVGYVGTGTSGANFNDFWRFDHGLEIHEIHEKIDVNIFPNPTSENVMFTFSNEFNNEIKTITIYSANGRLITTKEILDNKFNWYTETNGVFLYSIMMDNVVLKSGKIIVK